MLSHVHKHEAFQRNKGELTHLARLLHRIPISEGNSKRISMEFITCIPMEQGQDCIYVLVDTLKKYSHFFTIPARYFASQVAELFFREYLWLHGIPKTIVSGR